MRFLIAALALALSASAQTTPVVSGALNSASFADPSAPGGKLARGGIFSVFGSWFAEEQAIAGSFPLAEKLGKTELEITVGGTVAKAFPVFVSAAQINAILPSQLPQGQGQLVVIVEGRRSEPFAIETADHAPGVFTLRGTGGGPAVMTNPLNPNPDTRINSGASAAHAGERWDLWATGLGPIDASDAGPPPFGDHPEWNVQVLVGGREAIVEYRGRSGCCAGLDQVRFIVPDGVEGCCVPVELIVDGVVSNAVSMSIAGAGKQLCQTDLLADIPDELASFYSGEEVSYGSMGVVQTRTHQSPSEGVISAAAAAWFVRWRFAGVFDPCLTYSTLTGPCTVTRGDGVIAFDLDGNELGRTTSNAPAAALSIAARATPPVPRATLEKAALAQIGAALGVEPPSQTSTSHYLDVGPSVTLAGPSHNISLTPFDLSGYGPYYSGELLAQKPYLSPNDKIPTGAYSFRAPGGPDLGGFSVDIEAHNLDWPGFADAYPEIRRDEPFRVQWSGGSGLEGWASIHGISTNSELNGISSFVCTTELDRGQLTLHPNMLREIYRGEDGSSGLISVTLQHANLRSVAGIENVAVGYSETISADNTIFTGEGFEAPPLQFLVKVDPQYPPEARQMGIEGTVEITLAVGADGVPLYVLNTHGDLLLTEAVRDVALQWRIAGAALRGPFVEVEVTFSLTDGVSVRIVEDVDE